MEPFLTGGHRHNRVTLWKMFTISVSFPVAFFLDIQIETEDSETVKKQRLTRTSTVSPNICSAATLSVLWSLPTVAVSWVIQVMFTLRPVIGWIHCRMRGRMEPSQMIYVTAVILYIYAQNNRSRLFHHKPYKHTVQTSCQTCRVSLS